MEALIVLLLIVAIWFVSRPCREGWTSVGEEGWTSGGDVANWPQAGTWGDLADTFSYGNYSGYSPNSL